MKILRFVEVFALIITINLSSVHAQDNAIAPISSGSATAITSDNASKIEALASLSGGVKDVSVSPDSSMMAIINEPENQIGYTISIFALNTGNQIGLMQGGMDSFYQLVWSPDSKKIAVINRRTNPSGEERVVMTYIVELSANFRHYIVGGDNFFGDFVYSSDGFATPVQIAWSPSSDLLAIALNDHLEIDDVNTNEQLSTFPISGVQSLQWTSDGKFIITQSKFDQSDQVETKFWGIPSS